MSQRQFGCVTMSMLWMLIALVLTFLFVRDFPPALSEIFGVALGVLVGVVACLYLRRTWDPAGLRPIHLEDDRPEIVGWLLPVSVGGGILLSIIGRSFFSVAFDDMLFWGIGTALLIGFGYMLVHAFLNRDADEFE